MNWFAVLIIILQLGATIWEWSHGKFYPGLIWLGCMIANIGIVMVTKAGIK